MIKEKQVTEIKTISKRYCDDCGKEAKYRRTCNYYELVGKDRRIEKFLQKNAKKVHFSKKCIIFVLRKTSINQLERA